MFAHDHHDRQHGGPLQTDGIHDEHRPGIRQRKHGRDPDEPADAGSVRAFHERAVESSSNFRSDEKPPGALAHRIDGQCRGLGREGAG